MGFDLGGAGFDFFAGLLHVNEVVVEVDEIVYAEVYSLRLDEVGNWGFVHVMLHSSQCDRGRFLCGWVT